MYTIVCIRKKRALTCQVEYYEEAKVVFSDLHSRAVYALGETFLYSDLPDRNLLQYKKWDLKEDGKPRSVRVK